MRVPLIIQISVETFFINIVFYEVVFLKKCIDRGAHDRFTSDVYRKRLLSTSLGYYSFLSIPAKDRPEPVLMKIAQNTVFGNTRCNFCRTIFHGNIQ